MRNGGGNAESGVEAQLGASSFIGSGKITDDGSSVTSPADSPPTSIRFDHDGAYETLPVSAARAKL